MGDIRKELEDRMNVMQTQASDLQRQKDEVDRKLQDITTQLSALRTVYEGEAKRLGGGRSPINRFAGMKITGALQVIRNERPQITKEQAHKILEKEGFDFRGKKPRRVINFAWMALDRKKK